MMIYSKAEGPCHAVGNRAFQVTQGQEILRSFNKQKYLCLQENLQISDEAPEQHKEETVRPVRRSSSPRGQDSTVVPRVGILNLGQKEKGGNLPKYRLITATGKIREMRSTQEL